MGSEVSAGDLGRRVRWDEQLLGFLAPQRFLALPPAWRYGLATAISLAAVVLRWALVPWVGTTTPYNLSMLALVIVTVLLGLGPGLFAVLVGVVGVEGLVMGAAPSGGLMPLRAGLAGGIGIFVACLLHAGRAAHLRAARSSARLAAFAGATFEGIVESEAGRIVDCNEQFAQLAGYTVAELKGRPLASLAMAEAAEPPAADGGAHRAWVPEHGLLRKDGTRLIIETHSRPVPAQSPRRFTAVRDVTARKQAEAARETSERKYRVLFESSQDAIMTLAPPAWRFTAGNPATLAMFGARDEAEFIALSPWALSPDRQPDGRASAALAQAILEEAMRDGSHFFEWTHRRLNGEEFPATVLLTRIELEGRALLQATIRDITVPKRAERELQRLNAELEQRVLQRTGELRKAEEHYRGIFNGAVEGIYRSTPEGRCLAANPALAKMLGYATPEEVTDAISAAASQVWVDPQARAQYVQLLESTDAALGLECQFKRKDGGPIWVALNSQRVAGPDGRTLYYQGFIEDITERKRLEEQVQQAQKMEAVGQLAGGVAHDFNNILQSIFGFTEMLLLDLPPASRQHGDLLEIKAAAKRAAALTRQLLAFSRRQMIQPTLLDLNGLVRNMHSMLYRLIGEDIQFTTELAADLPHVTADAGQIEQIVMNLAVNARDALPQGGRITITTAHVTLTAAARHTMADARPGRFVRLAVADTGTGIAPDVLPRIFEPFFSTKGVGEGTGLGLSVIYGIARQHNGWIHVASQVGQGSIFQLYLPAHAGLAAAPEAPAPPPPVPPRGQGERILLIEDEPEIRQLAERLLAAAGYAVQAAGTAAEGRALFAQAHGRFDLVFCDVVLPDQNGVTTVEQLLQQQPGLAVLLCSGYTDERSRWHTIAEKQFRFLQKPYPPAELVQAVHAVLAARPAPGG